MTTEQRPSGFGRFKHLTIIKLALPIRAESSRIGGLEFAIAYLSKEASMPRPASRFVEKLTKSQLGKLEDLMDHGDTPRLRHRAHAVLLSHQGVCVVDLAEVFHTSRTTISQWLDRWDAEGFDGLADKARSGSPPKLTETQQSRVVELLKQSPQNPTAVLPQIKQEMGKEISRSTLRRIAKKAGLVWKRMRKSLGNKRDQKNFAAQA